MICPNCGKESVEGALFCRYCGTKLTVPQVEQTPGPQPYGFGQPRPQGQPGQSQAQNQGQPYVRQPDPHGQTMDRFAGMKAGGSAAAINNVKKSNKLPIIIAAVAVVAVIAIAALVVPGLGKTKIDLKDYINVSATGYDGYGYLYLDADYEGFRQKLYLAAGSTEPLNVFEDSIDYPYADTYEYLKNGDKITITWKMPDGLDKACKAKFKNEEFTYKVSELAEIENVDIFDEAQFIVEGIAPNGYAYIESDYDIRFELDKSEGLSNGDKVTVTISAWDDEYDVQEYLAQNYGVIAKSLTKEYEVTGLNEYVTKLGDIPDTVMNNMDERVREVFEDDVASTWDENEELSSVELLGCYLLVSKGSDYSDQNYIVLVYKNHYNNTGEDKISEDYYAIGVFRNLVKNGDGEVTVDLYECEVGGPRLYFNNSYYVDGYESLEILYNSTVGEMLDDYNVEDSLKS